MNLQAIYEKASSGQTLSLDEARFIAAVDDDQLQLLLRYALSLKEQHFGKTISFCAIINAKSGKCPEDCRFCAQSSHYSTPASTFPFLSSEIILNAAKTARDCGVKRFSIVTSGMRLSNGEFSELLDIVRQMKEMDILPDISIGFLSDEEIQQLKEAGLSAIHHNLETSRSYFPFVCSTHEYDRDVEVAKASVKAGLYTCSGGIFGLGESWDDRIELAETLGELNVDSVPVNFLTPIPGTPYESRKTLDRFEALKVIALLRFLLPDKHIRVCGGREAVFGSDFLSVYTSGASGVMVGDYLTTTGSPATMAREAAELLGLKIV